MKTIQVKQLTKDNFAKYGQFENMINPTTLTVSDPPVEFYRDMVLANYGTKNVGFSIVRVLPRPFVIDVYERHENSPEIFLPLDNDVYVHLAPAMGDPFVKPEDVEVFFLPKGTIMLLNNAVWHKGPFTANDQVANVLCVVQERGYVADNFIYHAKDDEIIKFEP